MTDSQRRYRLTENPLPKHLRAWTLDEVRQLRVLASEGHDIQTIARKLRRSISAIERRSRAHGIRISRGNVI